MIPNIVNQVNSFLSRGHERTALIKKNIFFSLILKGLSMVAGFALIPVILSYINTTEYGLWVTLVSIIAWINFFDIGLANGLKNKLAESVALGYYKTARIYVSTTYALLTIIAIAMLLVFSLINPFLNWRSILNFHAANVNLTSLAFVLFCIFCVQFVVQIINAILTALQVPSKVSLIAFISQFVSLLVMFLLSRGPRIPLIYIVSIIAGIPLVTHIGASFWFFRFSLRKLRPNFKLVNFKYSRDLLSLGGIFFLIQLGALILLQTDNILIIRLFGAQKVTIFNIAFKLYSAITMIFTIMITPFWSAFTDAFTKKDFAWIELTLSKLQKYWFFFALGTIALYFLAPFIYKIWLSNTIPLPKSLSFVLLIWVLAYSWQTMYVYFLNGIGKIRLQLYLIIFTSIINIPLAIYLSQTIGLAGITLSNDLVFILLGVIYYIQTKLILANKAQGIFNR